MRTNRLFVLVGTALSTILIGACGGGGDRVAGIDGGGSPAPVAISIVSQGTITGFGSVIVNGVRYETSGATITIDGDPGVESDLVVGQVVTVSGTIDQNGTTGNATNIDFDDAVEGPIQSIDLVNNSMVVLAQTVLVNGDTSFEDDISQKSLEGLSVTDVVEVSGYLDADGNIVATHVELENPGGELEITGFAANVDASALTFEINSLVVDYSAAALNDFPNGAPEDGQLVEAKGNALGAAGELLATEVEFKGNDLDFDDIDEVEVEGLITRFDTATDFDVSGVPVTTNGSTVYENGTSADLALNRKVEVEGQIDGTGVLVAEKVDFKNEGVFRIESIVEDVQSDRLTLLGIEVVVPPGTEFDDQSNLRVPNFDLGDVNVGDYVEIRGFDDMGTITATRLERDDDPGEVSLRGIVESVADPEFMILGVTIQTNTGTDFEDNEIPIAAADFFNQALGRLVEAQGVLQNGTIIANEVELED